MDSNYIKAKISMWLSTHMNIVFDSQKKGFDGLLIGEIRNLEENKIISYGLRHNGNCFVVNVGTGNNTHESEQWFSNDNVEDNEVREDIYDMLMDMNHAINSDTHVSIVLDRELDSILKEYILQEA